MRKIARYVNTQMPLPLSFAFMAMKAVRHYHASPVFERPFQLQRIYLARALTYGIVAAVSAAGFFGTKLTPTTDE